MALRSAADHITCLIEEHTCQIAAGLAHIDEHLELAESNGELYRQYIAFALEDSRHAIMDTRWLPVHARALAGALFQPTSRKLAKAKDQGWLTASRKLDDARELLVNSLSSSQQGYGHIAEALELIDQLNRACPS